MVMLLIMMTAMMMMMMMMKTMTIKISTFFTRNTYRTLKISSEFLKIKYANQSFNDFFKTEAMNLKKLTSFFEDAIHFHPGHLQPMTLMFIPRALVK